MHETAGCVRGHCHNLIAVSPIPGYSVRPRQGVAREAWGVFIRAFSGRSDVGTLEVALEECELLWSGLGSDEGGRRR